MSSASVSSSFIFCVLIDCLNSYLTRFSLWGCHSSYPQYFLFRKRRSAAPEEPIKVFNKPTVVASLSFSFNFSYSFFPMVLTRAPGSRSVDGTGPCGWSQINRSPVHVQPVQNRSSLTRSQSSGLTPGKIRSLCSSSTARNSRTHRSLSCHLKHQRPTQTVVVCW